MANTFKNKMYDGSNTSANALMNVYHGSICYNNSCDWHKSYKHDTSQIMPKSRLSAGDEMGFLAKTIPIPAGSSFEYMGGNKVIMETGHTLSVSSNTANSLDTVAI